MQVKLDNRGLIDWELWCVDGSSVRATRAAAGADKKVSSDTRANPPTTRWVTARLSSPKSDGYRTPLAIEVTAGEAHESTRAESVIEKATATPIARRRQERGRRHKPRQLAGDKRYSSQRLRDWLEAQDIEPVIPHKDNELARHDTDTWFDKLAYRGRCVVEQCVGWLKESHRIATRFEKLAVNFHGMLQLAMIDPCFRLLF